MNLILELFQLVLEYAKQLTPGKTAQAAEKAGEVALAIIAKVRATHLQATGKPLDESSIQPIAPIPQAGGSGS